MQRILDLSNSPARLRIDNARLVVQREAGQTIIPLRELAVLIVAHRQVTYTHAVLAGVMEAGGIFITCNARSLPVGMLLPLDAHHTQVERFAAQAAVKLPVKKRLWRQIVRAKIRAQAAVLQQLHDDDAALTPLIDLVRSGDPANVEARAARRYWPALFLDQAFRRDRDNAGGANAALNYGYAVLRAVVARAICAAGLHPSLGLHHHNRYSTYPLADDLMEPLRPLIDLAVARFVAAEELPDRLTPEIKRCLLEAILDRYAYRGEDRTLFDVAQRMAASLCDVLMGESREMVLPELF